MDFSYSFLLGIEILIVLERAKGLFYFFLGFYSFANEVSLTFIVLNEIVGTFMCWTLCRKSEDSGVRERSVAEWV